MRSGLGCHGIDADVTNPAMDGVTTRWRARRAICPPPQRAKSRRDDGETGERRRQRLPARQRHLGGTILLPRSGHRRAAAGLLLRTERQSGVRQAQDRPRTAGRRVTREGCDPHGRRLACALAGHHPGCVRPQGVDAGALRQPVPQALGVSAIRRDTARQAAAHERRGAGVGDARQGAVPTRPSGRRTQCCGLVSTGPCATDCWHAILRP